MSYVEKLIFMFSKLLHGCLFIKKSSKETHTSQFKEINNYKYIFLLKNKKADLQTEKLEVFGKFVQASLRQLMAGKSTPTVSQEQSGKKVSVSRKTYACWSSTLYLASLSCMPNFTIQRAPRQRLAHSLEMCPWDGSVGKGSGHQAWQLEFHHCDPHDRELTLAGCTLTSPHAL